MPAKDFDELQKTTDASSHLSWGQRGTVGPVFAGNIEIRDLCFDAGAKRLLSNISFSLAAGEIGCLLGASGCGKSTLLRLMAGLEPQSSGRILMDGVEIAGPSSFVPPEKRSIGLMFQDFALFPHLSIVENVMFGLYALSRTEARQAAEKALDRVGLLDLRDMYPATLSGGEQQRVALARTVVPRPQIVLMDEPFSGLDQRLRQSIRTETVGLLREMRATALLVTHDPQEALEIADKIILMREGRIVQVGGPYELLDQPRSLYTARFLSPADELTDVVRNARISTPLGPIPALRSPDGTGVTILLRPEAVVPSDAASAVQGRVVATARRGRGVFCQIVIGGLDVAISARIDGLNSVRVGEVRGFELRLDQVLAFETETGLPI
jgi:iron(III) transport system ATP-binding protein